MLINKHEKETQRHPFDDPDVKELASIRVWSFKNIKRIWRTKTVLNLFQYKSILNIQTAIETQVNFFFFHHLPYALAIFNSALTQLTET